MRKHKWRILLLILVVILLSIVSSRVSPSLPTPDDTSISAPGEATIPSESPSVPDDISPPDVSPSASPEVSEKPKYDLPDISIHEWNLKLVNNRNVLTESFTPDVTAIANGQYFDSRAVDALNALVAGAASNGYSSYISTAYRPYSTQAYIFYGKASQIAWGGEVEYAEAEIMARELVAYPGTSEHQLGLAVDIIDSADTYFVAEEVEELPLLLWLKDHCHEYGFILRYPKDKEDITGWYEPWHFRYVGLDAAKFMYENNLCLEEFIDLYLAN
ncbi:MAG: D-alanyl-D-alanine carboxypeptidase family protein [Ruminococcaceae bacterium]|nr:D-alanyl-D-alanine carboxypeptidase family protein [Oscillospiraceae bacterium]